MMFTKEKDEVWCMRWFTPKGKHGANYKPLYNYKVVRASKAKGVIDAYVFVPDYFGNYSIARRYELKGS